MSPVEMRKSLRRETAVVVEEGKDFADNLPSSHRLFVTTANQVFEWSRAGCTPVFRSKTGGIVTAAKVLDGSDRLAIADSQVVVLHTLDKGVERSYRLKGTKGRVRLLQYVEESGSLHFTTSLQDSIQTYSMQHEKVLASGHTHPSPISCFAFSKSKGFTVSISARPPTVCLQTLTSSGRPVYIQPESSSAPATCVSFHPHRHHLFLLAFADQVVAVYDYNRTLRQARRKDEVGLEAAKKSKEISHVQLPNPKDSKLKDRGMGIQSGIAFRQIVAAQFLPLDGIQAVVLSDNGQCSIVDFEKERTSRIVRSWSVPAPATSLTILADTGDVQSSEGCLIAVGRADGVISVFNLSGDLSAQQRIESGDKVINIEWIDSVYGSATTSRVVSTEEVGHSKAQDERAGGVESAEMKKPVDISGPAETISAPTRLNNSTTAPTPQTTCTDNENLDDMPEEFARPDMLKASATIEQTVNQERPGSKGIDWQDVIEPYSTNYMNLFSPVKALPPKQSAPKAATLPKSKDQKSGKLRVQELVNSGQGETCSAISAPQLWGDVPTSSSRNRRLPAVPPRPAIRKKRRVSISKTESPTKRVRSGTTELAVKAVPIETIISNESRDRQARDEIPLPDVQQNTNQLPRSTEIADTEKSRLKKAQKSSRKGVSFEDSNPDEYQEGHKRAGALENIKIHCDPDDKREQIPAPPRTSSIRAHREKQQTRQSSSSSDQWTIPLSPSKSANRPPQPLSPTKHDSENCRCKSPSYVHDELAKLRASMKSEMSAFQFDLRKQFLAQKMVFEEVLTKERAERRALKREVEMLRREVAEKQKGPAGLLAGL